MTIIWPEEVGWRWFERLARRKHDAPRRTGGGRGRGGELA